MHVLSSLPCICRDHLLAPMLLSPFCFPASASYSSSSECGRQTLWGVFCMIFLNSFEPKKKSLTSEVLPVRICNVAPAWWNFSFSHVTSHFSAALIILSLFTLFFSLVFICTPPPSVPSPLSSITAAHSHPAGFPDFTVPFFSRLLLFFVLLSFLTCNVLGLMPHNPGWRKTEMSELQENNNNRKHRAKRTLSEFHYCSPDSLCYSCPWDRSRPLKLTTVSTRNLVAKKKKFSKLFHLNLLRGNFHNMFVGFLSLDRWSGWSG